MLGQRLEHFGNRRVPAPTLRGPEGKRDEAETATVKTLLKKRQKWRLCGKKEKSE